ncbi:MAG: hypothetical protein AB8G86_11330 [Saprospiraceae bacterium]
MKRRIKGETEKQTGIQNIEASLCKELGIPSLRAGRITIRDEQNWRVNEKEIDYCWLINIARSFAGWCWLFTIKFNKTKFREIHNPDEVIQGIFKFDKNSEIEAFTFRKKDNGFIDNIKELNSVDLFNANTGITLGGISYEYFIFARNTQISFFLNNPNSENWKIWEKAVWELGSELSKKSNSTTFQDIFQ